MIKDNYELDILVNGKPVKTYYHDGKYYAEGKKGTAYSLRVKNNGYRRILVVPSVDGLNVLTGKVANVNDRGYIVDGHSSMVIDGWRTSDKEVAEFFFSEPAESYADKKGKGGNIGVIGCAVFKEQDKDVFRDIKKAIDEIDKSWPKPFDPWYPWKRNYPYWLSEKTTFTVNHKDYQCLNTNGTANNAGDGKVNAFYSSVTPSQGVGTGWGDTKKSEVVSVEFEREPLATELFAVYYNTRENLEKLGINLNERAQYITPDPFPGSSGYCTPPER